MSFNKKIINHAFKFAQKRTLRTIICITINIILIIKPCKTVCFVVLVPIFPLRIHQIHGVPCAV